MPNCYRLGCALTLGLAYAGAEEHLNCIPCGTFDDAGRCEMCGTPTPAKYRPFPPCR